MDTADDDNKDAHKGSSWMLPGSWEETTGKRWRSRVRQQEVADKRLLARGGRGETDGERPPRRGRWKEASNEVRGH